MSKKIERFSLDWNDKANAVNIKIIEKINTLIDVVNSLMEEKVVPDENETKPDACDCTSCKSEIKLLRKKEKTVWNLEIGNTYWLISGKGIINHGTYSPTKKFLARREIGNIFLTKEQAQKELEWRKKRAKDCKYGLREIKQQ